eukprot:1020577-Pelagomonas_calceolata.AAC.2
MNALLGHLKRLATFACFWKTPTATYTFSTLRKEWAKCHKLHKVNAYDALLLPRKSCCPRWETCQKLHEIGAYDALLLPRKGCCPRAKTCKVAGAPISQDFACGDTSKKANVVFMLFTTKTSLHFLAKSLCPRITGCRQKFGQWLS